jgi:D-lactate dehydrogenase
MNYQLADAFHQVTDHIVDEVIVPLGAMCCGAATYHGLLHAELVVSATRDEREITPADSSIA